MEIRKKNIEQAEPQRGSWEDPESLLQEGINKTHDRKDFVYVIFPVGKKIFCRLPLFDSVNTK